MANKKNLTELLNRNPYKIKETKKGKTIITLNDIKFAELSHDMATTILPLLNGAYKEGVIQAFSSQE